MAIENAACRLTMMILMAIVHWAMAGPHILYNGGDAVVRLETGKRVHLGEYDAARRMWSVRAEEGGEPVCVDAGHLELDLQTGVTLELRNFKIQQSNNLMPDHGKADGMLDEAGGSIAMVAEQRIEPGTVVHFERPLLRGAVGLVYGTRNPACKALVEGEFLRLKDEDKQRVLQLCQKALTRDAGQGVVSDNELLELLKFDGVQIPPGMESSVLAFAKIWKCNAITLGEGAALFPEMSRINHNCAPNAARLEHDGGLRLVAIQAIEAGEEITMSYVQDSDLILPASLRKTRLSAWFGECACARCKDPTDVSRRFSCPAKCGKGECVSSGGSLGACSGCNEKYGTVAGLILMSAAAQVELKLIRMETEEVLGSVEDIKAALEAARGCMAQTHWAVLGLRCVCWRLRDWVCWRLHAWVFGLQMRLPPPLWLPELCSGRLGRQPWSPMQEAQGLTALLLRYMLAGSLLSLMNDMGPTAPAFSGLGTAVVTLMEAWLTSLASHQAGWQLI